MQPLLIALQILVAVALIGLILLQQGKGADAGAAFGSGTSGSIFGARGPSSFLAKITALLAAVFFVNSLTLAYIAGQSIERKSVVERVALPPDQMPPVQESQPEKTQAPASAPVPGPADVPVAPTGTSQ